MLKEVYQPTSEPVAMAEPAYILPNFAFLAKHDEMLVRHATCTEHYAFDASDFASLKLCQFGQSSAQHAVMSTNIDEKEHTTQVEWIDNPDQSATSSVERYISKKLIMTVGQIGLIFPSISGYQVKITRHVPSV